MVEKDVAAARADSLAEGNGDSAHKLSELDPLDPRKVAFDVFEVYCQEMLSTTSVARRASLVNHLSYMLKRLIMHQYDYGRLYNRTCIANIVSRVCGAHPYVVPDEVEGFDRCLVDFTPSKWRGLIARFEKLRTSMIRNDASVIILPSKLQLGDDEDRLGDVDENKIPAEDNGINEEFESHSVFSERYNEVSDLIKFHTCLSHLQPQLGKVIQGKESVVIPNENIVEFQSAIEELFEDKENCKHARILTDFLEEDNRGDLHLKSLSEIKAMYAHHSRVFDLQRFQNKFLRLIRRWDELVLPVPELSKFNYGSVNDCGGVTEENEAASVNEKDNANSAGAGTLGARKQQCKHQKNKENRNPSPAADSFSFENDVDEDFNGSASEDESEEKMSAREVLKEKTEALRKIVNDPESNCVEIAKSAQTFQKVDKSEDGDDSSDGGVKVKTPTFRKKKKSAQQLRFDSDSENSTGKVAALSEVPARYKSQRREATPEVQLPRKKGRKRIPFTEEESNAIDDGVKKYGEGSWEKIRRSYLVLRNRTGTQIKDRWRTMEKHRLEAEESSG